MRTGKSNKTQEWKPPEKRYEVTSPTTPPSFKPQIFTESLTCDALSPIAIVQSISSSCMSNPCNQTVTSSESTLNPKPAKTDGFIAGIIRHFDSGSHTLETGTYDTRLTNTTTTETARQQKSGWSTIFDALSEDEEEESTALTPSMNNEEEESFESGSDMTSESGSPRK